MQGIAHPRFGAGGWVSQPPRLTPAMQFAILASVLVHAAVLSLRFAFPDASRLRSPPQTLDVILVNSKSATRPAEAQALAQANLDGGGNTDENRRAKTPLPATREVEHGDDVKRARQKVKELEAKQRQLLTQAQTPAPAVVTETAKPDPAPEPAKPLSGADLVNSALALARLEAQIARQVDEYNKRPRKAFVGARAVESRFAQYVEDWRLKIERIGNLNYPQAARDLKLYGNLVLTVSIRADGSVESVQVNRSSGQRVLDAAAIHVVEMSAPFAPFPPDIRRDTDILHITRTWSFTKGDQLRSD